MHPGVRILVEGKEDRYFLESYIRDIDCYGSVLEIRCICGWGNLGGQCPGIERNLDDGERILIVFDADEDCKKRKSEIEKVIRTKPGREITTRNSDLDIFLFPDNQRQGKIEHLLEEIALPEHKGIFDCFESYEKCLQERSVSYQPPGIKGKIYSYKEALGILKKNERDHFKPEHWDFQSSSLDPLKDFLLRNLS